MYGRFRVQSPAGRYGRGLRAVLDFLGPDARSAVLEANRAYASLGVPYALCGGLAAGAHGDPRVTKDIDFLVGDEAFVRTGRIVSFAKPMPLRADPLAIDPIPLPEAPARRAFLEQALAAPEIDRTTSEDVPVLSATAVAYMKLASPRGKDRSDIVGMMRAGRVDLTALRAAVAQDPELRTRLDEALAELALEADE